MVKKLLKLSNIVKADPIHYFLLGSLLILFLVTRFLHIDRIPASVYWDEASIGYNAYAIGETGRDEWGEFLPVHFRAFGEFKLPVYIYSLVPFVKLFGLNAFSVRAPAVFYSLLCVILTYLIGKKLFGKTVALLSAFFLIISPWFFIFTRGGYEAMAGLAFFLLALYFYIVNKSKKMFVLASLSLILSIYSYNSFRIISPILFFYMTAAYSRHNFKKNLKFLIISLILFLVFLIPVIRLFIYDAGSGRTQAFSLIPSVRQVYDIQGNPRLQLIFDRRAGIDWFENFKTILGNYFSHFSLDFLLLGDKNSRSQQPGTGQIYLLDIFLFFIGLSYLLRRKQLMLVSLMLLGVLPAMLFKDSPHALRTISTVPFFITITAFGLFSLLERFKKVSTVILMLSFILYLAFFENYYMNFINKYPKVSSKDWQYAYSEIFQKYALEIEKADRVVITDEYAQPYIFALFNLKYDPGNFLKERRLGKVENWGFSTVEGFGKFEFRKVAPSDIAGGNILFVSPDERPKFPPESAKIKFLDGSDALYVYKP